MKCLTKIMDVDDDDEYTNVAAAHAAFVMAVSAVKMYWLLRHAQHTCDINIYMQCSTHFQKKNQLVSADFYSALQELY